MTDNHSWHAAAIKDLTETDMSYQEIGDKYGRSRDTIIKLKNRYRLTRKHPPRRGIAKLTERSELSSTHRAVGIHLTLYRDGRNFSEVAPDFGVSAVVLRYMELGIHEFTLSQLQKISDVLGRSIPELITPFHARVSDPTTKKAL